jgi:sugar/nucleoside kinase (ribokinase family)
MFQLLAIGDPIIDTHVQIDHDTAECSVIPHANSQKLCFDYGSKIPILNSFQNLGGNAPNVAAGATRLGLKTAVLSTVGNDINGKIALEQLAKMGIDTKYITVDKNTTTRYSIVLNYDQERTILSYSDKKQYYWPKNVATDWIYYTGLSAGFETLQKELLNYLKLHPTVHLAVNPGSYLLKFAIRELNEIIKRTDTLILNLEEAEKILNTTLEKEKSVTALIRKLIARGPSEVAITDAERGAWTGTKSEMWHQKAFPVGVIAKTGAGDAFSAGYLTARFHGHDLNHALSWGIANSAGVIQAHGTQTGLLDESGIKKQLEVFPLIEPIKL